MRRFALVALLALAAIGLVPDCLASDRPLLARIDGELYVLPDLIDYDALAGRSGEALSTRLGPDDWALWPPIRYSPTAVRSHGRLEPLSPPSSEHWLGTDDRGRDVAARLVHGVRSSLVMVVWAIAWASGLGLVVALVLAWAGGAARSALDTVCDGLTALPAWLAVIALRGLLGGGGLALAAFLIALPRLADTARTTAAVLRRALAEPYCEAARALGASRWRVVVIHGLPAARANLATATAITCATAVLGEVALSFLGFGVAPPTASLGDVLRQASDNGLRPWLAVPAGIAVTILALLAGILARPAGGKRSHEGAPPC